MNYTQYENEYTNTKLENSYFYSGEQINQPEDDEQITMEQMKKEFYEEQRQMDAELDQMNFDEQIFEEQMTLGDWLKADDEQFKREVEEYNRIQAKLDKEREARKPTEAEIQEEEQKFFDDCKKDKLKQQRQNERYEKWIEEHYNSHPNTTIKLDDPLNVQIRKMLAELEVEKKEEAEKERQKAVKRSNRLMATQSRLIWEKTVNRKKREQKLNAKGKMQGVKKEEEKKPMGSRARRREKKEVAIVLEKKEQIVVQDYIKSGLYATQFNQTGMVINEEEEDVEEDDMPIITSSSTIFNLDKKIKTTKKAKKAINSTDIMEKLFSTLGITKKKIVTKVTSKKTVNNKFTKVTSKKTSKRTVKETNKPIIAGKSYRQEMQDKKPVHNTTKTAMCKSFLNNTKCYHGKKCRYAHSIEELNIIECRFGSRCRFSEKCTFMHSESETKESYLARIGVVKPKQTKKQYKAPVAPWANKTKQSVQKTRKTRWDQKPAEKSVQKPIVQKARKSRWD